MRSGKYRHQVDFYKKQETITDTGGREYALVSLKSGVWASANTRKMSENFTSDAEKVIVDVVITTRYDASLDIDNIIIKFNNKQLKVISVDNLNFRNIELIFRCEYVRS